MVWSASKNALITASWDRTLRFWDPRADAPQQTCETMPERVYHVDIVGHMLVLAMASRLVRIYDTRRMEAPLAGEGEQFEVFDEVVGVYGEWGR